ncbi:Gfo/Idh/MocA family protein [Actinomadura xylanilytica]|uniref:Gfo/Idh/MocA family protein n=1 Tax=Actinomadura xylanilytica TaxID=887459 RepID=UPI00255B1291|nr:hypothetical protein [Actinomadura xylanilytica]MDL4775409.1 hypothetical protein [Actinomadura xylanilytica]
MRVAFAGLATDYHPAMDARLLRERGVHDLVVWAEDAARFAAESGARPAGTLDALIAARPDAAIVTCRPASVPDVVRRLAAAGIPAFITKPAVGTAADLARLDEVVTAARAPVSTASVLRFAPETARLRARLGDAPVLGVRVTVRHAIDAYLAPERRWLDDPARGGGTLATMGLHGVELASALLGTGLTARWAARASRVHAGSLSEDTGVIGLGWPDGRHGVVEVLGATEREWYEAAVHTSEGTHAVRLDGAAPGPDPFGYAGTVEAFLAGVAAGRPAVPWATTREVLAALVTARSLAGG